MDESKKPWQSKTIWLNLVGGLVGSAVLFFPHAQVVQDWIVSNMAVISMVWGVLGIIVRVLTKGSIELKD